MPRFVAQIAPQKSTQYANMARQLAPHELRLSSPGASAPEFVPVELGGQDYLEFELPEDLTQVQARELGALAMTSAFFQFHERLGQFDGPFLQPIETGFSPALPEELVTTRRYRGKTNELFTHFLCNVARSSSGLASRSWDTLRVLDPLFGGGTTLFVALTLGASAAGVEHRAQDIHSTAAFLRQFLRGHGIRCRERHERLKQAGQRWSFTIGEDQAQQCILARGDTSDAALLTSGFRPHLIVTDLPYGIQHQGQLTSILTSAIPAWASLLSRGGAMVFAWESTHFPRSEMMELVESLAPLRVLDDPPYDALAHRVDRVIKRRDVLVARPNTPHRESCAEGEGR